MTYTLWSNGRCLGETDLELTSEEGHRCGVLRPTPDFVQVRPLLLDSWRIVWNAMMIYQSFDAANPAAFFDSPTVKARTAESAEAMGRMRALGFELRDAGGAHPPESERLVVIVAPMPLDAADAHHFIVSFTPPPDAPDDGR